MKPPAAKTLIIGLDGATWDLIRPFQESGHLPVLASLMADGAHGPLRSTDPPMTFPAWSSFMTGMGPGKHGVFDFSVHVDGEYAVRFTNASFRKAETIWSILSRRGLRVGAMGFPTTYPPEPVNGVMISGFDAPVTTGIDASFVHPRPLYRELKRTLGPYAITEFQEINIGPGWHAKALDGLFSALERKLEYALYLLERKGPWDCFGVLLGESDTVAHHFWAFHDPRSPRYDPAGAEYFGSAILRVYQAIDKAVGRMVERAGGDDTTVLILSDHGFGGAGTKAIHLNRWLAARGWLRYRPAAGGGPSIISRLKTWGMRHVPPTLQEQLFRRFSGRLASRIESATRYAAIDWTGTCAYSDELNYFPSIWINLAGREPAGTVQPGEHYDRTIEMIRDGLYRLTDPETGLPVVKRAWRREELYRGPHVDLAPDLVLELNLDRDYSYTCLPSPAGESGPAVADIPPGDYLGAKGKGMNGTHRQYGILLMRGEGVAPGFEISGASLMDLAPTMLYLMDQEVPEAMDGRVLENALEASFLAARPVRHGAGGEPPVSAEPTPYSAAEEKRLRQRLKGLGYLEDD